MNGTADERGAEADDSPASPPAARRRQAPHAARHAARVRTLQALYEADQSGHDPVASVERLVEDSATAAETAAYARRLVAGVKRCRQDLDERIGQVAPQWPIQQIAVVDRNILRIAIYEMLLGGETPLRVAVNEAVELAKAFGSESSPRFVNGVLGAMTALPQDNEEMG